MIIYNYSSLQKRDTKIYNVGGYNIHPLYNSNEAFHKLNRPNLFYPFYLYLDEPQGDNFYNIGLEKKENCVEIYPPKSLGI